MAELRIYVDGEKQFAPFDIEKFKRVINSANWGDSTINAILEHAISQATGNVDIIGSPTPTPKWNWRHATRTAWPVRVVPSEESESDPIANRDYPIGPNGEVVLAVEDWGLRYKNSAGPCQTGFKMFGCFSPEETSWFFNIWWSRPGFQDVLLRATAAFETVLARPQPHGELVTLANADWEEEIPSNRMWHFVHHDFPGVMIDWTPGGEPIAHQTSMTAWRYQRRRTP